MAVRCPTCGQMPDEREVDPERQRRSNLARAGREILDGPLPDPRVHGSPVTTEVWDRTLRVVDETLDYLMRALDDASQEPAGLEAIKSLRQLEADVSAAPGLRPWIDLRAAAEEVLHKLHRVVGHYLSAAAADVPLDAQREAQRAQAELDGAADPAVALAERVDAWARVETAETVEQAVSVLAETAFERSKARTLIEFDRIGRAVYERVSGETVSLQGYGVGLNIIAEQARGPYDEARIWSLARRAFELLTGDPEWLSGILETPQWREDLKSALEKLWDAGRLHAAAMLAVRHDRQAVRALLDFGQDLVESTGKRYVATLIAASKHAVYAKYRNQSSGALLVAATKMGLSDFVSGLDRAVRIASAHDSFILDEDEVILIDSEVEVERLTVPVLVDRVLEGVETTLALGLGILCAAIHGGVELTDLLPDMASLGVAREDILTWILSSAGWRQINVRLEGESLIASGSADVGAVTMSHVAALSPYFPDGCTEVVVTADTSEGQRELRGSAELLKRFQEATSEPEKLARCVELLRGWVLNDRPLIDAKQSRKYLSVSALQSMASGDLRAAIRHARMFLATAQRVHDEELAEALTALLGGLRDSLVGLESATFAAAVELVTAWARMAVPPIDSSVAIITDRSPTRMWARSGSAAGRQPRVVRERCRELHAGPPRGGRRA